MAGVDVATVARVINLSISRCHALAKEPGFPEKLSPGEWDLQKVTLWYIRYLQTQARHRGPGGGPETAAVATERLRVLKGQAEKIELGNAVQRGDYISTDSVRIVWSRRVANTQKRLLGIPAKLGPQLINRTEPSYIADRMKQEIHAALNELASGGADLDEPPANGEDDPNVAGN
jgi:terminase small subunit / prophage DNA-packing protein